jgi:cellobiose-specific phosphotransferase system component IIC
VSQLKRNSLHYVIATVTSATTFNQRNKVAKVLLLPFLCLLLYFFGVEFDTKPCSAGDTRHDQGACIGRT